MKYVFEEMFPRGYGFLEKSIVEHIQDGDSILDVGAGKGIFLDFCDKHRKGCFIICLEPNYETYETLRNKKTKNNKFSVVNLGLADYLENEQKKFDVTIFQRSLHHINLPLEGIFRSLSGTLIIVDPYFGTKVSDKDFNLSMKNVMEKSGHSHNRSEFHNPDEIIKIAIENGFSLQYFNRYDENFGECYQIILKKVRN